MRRHQLALVGAFSFLATSVAQGQAGPPEIVARARAIHERVITLDTHNDINPANFTAERNYTQRLDNQVNLPKMVDGGLDVSFFIVYVGQAQDFTPEGYKKAYDEAIAKFDAIHRLTETIAPDKIGLALTPADAQRIAASGRKVAMIGIENAYPLGEDLKNIKAFYDRGGRYLSLAHNGHSQWSDSNNGEASGTWKWNGLSPLGRQAIAEMNRVGMMIDISHPSKLSSMQTFELSRAPVIASHSGVRALCNHSRNMDDEQLLALKKNGGVIQVVAFASYAKCDPPPPERAPALQKLYDDFGIQVPAARGGGAGGGGGGGRAAAGGAAGAGTGAAAAAPGAARGGGGGGAGGGGRGGRGGGALQAAIDSLPPDRLVEFSRRLAEIDRAYPTPARATVSDVVNHIDYAVKLIGIDHVGISSDFDGGGGVTGWNDASETFNVTLELVKRGYTEEQISKIWSGNLLRVMGEVQRKASK